MNKGGPNTATKISFSLNQCQNVFDGKTEKKKRSLLYMWLLWLLYQELYAKENKKGWKQDMKQISERTIQQSSQRQRSYTGV